MDWGLCQKDSIASLLLCSFETGIIQFVDMLISKIKNNVEEFQKSEVPFPVGILVQLNELQKGDGIIKSLKKKEKQNCMKIAH